MKFIFLMLKGCYTPCYVGLLCYHFDNKFLFDLLLIPSVLFLFCGTEIGMHKNTWPLRNGCTILCSRLFSGAQKGMTAPHLHQPNPPPINDRSLSIKVSK